MENTRFQFVRFRVVGCWLLAAAAMALASCAELEKPKSEPFYSQTAPPARREFRWSNGKMPASFDPALATAPPETDVVRAVFDGLTDLDPKTLQPIPSLATRWESSDDKKTWTFILRKDAKWTNGERVTAKDFVSSWERVRKMGEKAPMRKLTANIVGFDGVSEVPSAPSDPEADVLSPAAQVSSVPGAEARPDPTAPIRGNADPSPSPSPDAKREVGVTATDQWTLKVSLVNPDKDFPALVAHPLFRPVWNDGSDFTDGKLNAATVTNGTFRIVSVGQDGVTLDRSENHWDRAKVQLERVKFVPIETPEKALEAYRRGEIDAVTNAHFAPLALKLLKPFEDFRQTTHAALNFYEFNRAKAPFDDRRVRQALALAIDRERLTESELEGASRPATAYLPFFPATRNSLSEDFEKARKLMEESGFPNGENFPTIRLVINRNDTQQRVAKLIARVWEEELKVKTVVIPVESAEIERIRNSGEFDLVRRGVVLPAADEETSMRVILAPPTPPEPIVDPAATPSPSPTSAAGELPVPSASPSPEPKPTIPDDMLVQENALADVPVIPLYFPMSYSLVKPYVGGFELNVLDAPSLKAVTVDTAWQPAKTKDPS